MPLINNEDNPRCATEVKKLSYIKSALIGLWLLNSEKKLMYAMSDKCSLLCFC